MLTREIADEKKSLQACNPHPQFLNNNFYCIVMPAVKTLTIKVSINSNMRQMMNDVIKIDCFLFSLVIK